MDITPLFIFSIVVWINKEEQPTTNEKKVQKLNLAFNLVVDVVQQKEGENTKKINCRGKRKSYKKSR